MSVDHHRLSEALCREALSYPRNERERFLFGACGRDWIAFREAMDLVHAASRSEETGRDPEPTILETALDEPPSGVAPHRASEPSDARYKIVEVLGEGGMGIVYLADQVHPVRRRVALKVIKLGIDSKRAKARFESERQALAVMSHPGIARVYQAGATNDGRLYFAMEYVPGRPIGDFCDEARLRLEERSTLFADVCDAVHHAHQKGVIHRDLKPSNVLVCTEGGPGAPKIIDFGVAKAMSRGLVERTLFTQRGLIVGSLEYMSPEQADGRRSDIDTGTDIYSLGVMLYELLVGALPIDLSSAREQGYGEVERRIREVLPVRPSQRIREMGGDAEEVARRRSTSVEALARRLRGELDWIVSKALEKERVRRYASASEMAADIRRFLEGEPILAGRPSRGYRARKFVQRNRALVSAVAATVLALAVGTAVTTRLFIENRRVARLARSQAEAILRLSDIKRLEACVDEAERLYPPHPDKVPQMEAWLNGPVRGLVGRLPRHKEDLRQLREQLHDSRPGGAVAAVGDMSVHFPDAERQFLYDALSSLVNDLEKVANRDPGIGLIANVERRLELAKSIHRMSIEERAAEWSEAIASISDERECPMYGGMKLAPQLGLVPIGRDPRSGFWEFAHLATGRLPRRGSDGLIEIEEGDAIVLVLVPGGSFRMGAVIESDETAPRGNNYDNEFPVRAVSLSPFFISKYEMTQAQWNRLIGENPSDLGPGSEHHISLLQPVENVTWHMADRATRIAGLELPTEAQWEYAARGGEESPWWCGPDPRLLMKSANMAGPYGSRRDRLSEADLDDGYEWTAPVGSFAANPFGLHDVLGNVWEWCRDSYGPLTDPTDPRDGLRLTRDSGERVARGASFAFSPDIGVSRRVNLKPVFRDGIGVRPARSIER